MIRLIRNHLAALYKSQSDGSYWIITEDFNDCYGINASSDSDAINQYKKVYWRE